MLLTPFPWLYPICYSNNVLTPFSFQDDEVRVATRVALTVKDFNYYIGHAYVSLSRLHINMSAVPPRIVRLTAPRRTEMRRMMNQFRPPPPGSRREGPSGYIVDISRDEDNSGQVTERRSTRAVVNRGGGGFPGFGGLFGGMGLSVSHEYSFIMCVGVHYLGLEH